MTFKKLATLAMATVVSASLLVGCSGSKESAKDDKITVAMITDVAGVNDQSFNQSAWEGLQRAEKELGIEVKYLESKQDSDYATNIETLVDEDVDLILGVGMKLADAIKEGAELYPDQNFVLVDEEIDAQTWHPSECYRYHRALRHRPRPLAGGIPRHRGFCKEYHQYDPYTPSRTKRRQSSWLYH